MTPSFDVANLAMLSLAARYRIAIDYGNYKKGRRREVESVAHELAHGVVLCGRALSTVTIGRELMEVDDHARDINELAALRVEVYAMARLGIRISLRRQVGLADWNHGRPPRILWAGPLTKDERGQVGCFLRIVRDEIHRVCRHR